jgi:hypothetical protein
MDLRHVPALDSVAALILDVIPLAVQGQEIGIPDVVVIEKFRDLVITRPQEPGAMAVGLDGAIENVIVSDPK